MTLAALAPPLRIALAWALVASAALAQWDETPVRSANAQPPVVEIEFSDLRAHGAEEFGDLIGRPMVLYELPIYPPSSPLRSLTTETAAHYEALSQSFRDQGLVVMALVSGGRDPGELAEELGITHSIAVERNRVKRAKKVLGIGRGALFDPYGLVVYRGTVREEAVGAHLAPQLSTPVWEWAPEDKSVRTALRKRKWGDALKKAAKSSAALHDQLLEVVEGALAKVGRYREAGDIRSATILADAIKDELGSHELGKQAGSLLAELKKDKPAKAVLEAQEDLIALWTEWGSTRRDVDLARKLMKKVDKLAASAQSPCLDAGVEEFRRTLQDLIDLMDGR